MFTFKNVNFIKIAILIFYDALYSNRTIKLRFVTRIKTLPRVSNNKENSAYTEEKARC